MHFNGSCYFIFSCQDFAQFNHGSIGIVTQNKPGPLQITLKCITHEHHFGEGGRGLRLINLGVIKALSHKPGVYKFLKNIGDNSQF
jgi:hypothetical protein